MLGGDTAEFLPCITPLSFVVTLQEQSRLLLSRDCVQTAWLQLRSCRACRQRAHTHPATTSRTQRLTPTPTRLTHLMRLMSSPPGSSPRLAPCPVWTSVLRRTSALGLSAPLRMRWLRVPSCLGRALRSTDRAHAYPNRVPPRRCGLCWLWGAQLPQPLPLLLPLPLSPTPTPTPTPNQVWLVLAVERSVNDAESMGHWDALLKVYRGRRGRDRDRGH